MKMRRAIAQSTLVALKMGSQNLIAVDKTTEEREKLHRKKELSVAMGKPFPKYYLFYTLQ